MNLPRSRVAPAALRAAARNLPMVKLERKAVEELQAEGGEALANDVAQSVESRKSPAASGASRPSRRRSRKARTSLCRLAAMRRAGSASLTAAQSLGT